jgi:hypothetical protein
VEIPDQAQRDLAAQREQAARDLESAREAMDRKGWIRHRFSGADGMCLQGAVWKGAANDEDRILAAHICLWEYLRRAYAAELEGKPTGLSAVYYVNDHLLRDKDDAMDVLAKAAVTAREGVG